MVKCPNCKELTISSYLKSTNYPRKKIKCSNCGSKSSLNRKQFWMYFLILTTPYIYFFVKDSGKYYNYNYYSDIDRLRILNEVKPSEGGGLPKKPSRNQDKWPQTLSIEDYEMKWKKKVEQFNIEKKKNYKGKFTNETINMGTSPGARQSRGILYSLQRKTKVSKQNSLKINESVQKDYNLFVTY